MNLLAVRFPIGVGSAAHRESMCFLGKEIQMPKTVYRQVGSVRRSPRPRLSARSTPSFGGFDGLLAKLGLAQQQLKRSRKRK
jgi:hypothetical protein